MVGIKVVSCAAVSTTLGLHNAGNGLESLKCYIVWNSLPCHSHATDCQMRSWYMARVLTHIAYTRDITTKPAPSYSV